MRKLWKIENVEALYDCIECNESSLGIAMEEKDRYYKNILSIPKKDGVRLICSVDKTCKLYRIQKNLQKNFLDNIMISDCAYGFRKGRDYFKYLKQHQDFYGNSNYLRLDIFRFVDSISETMLKDVLMYYIETPSKEENELVMSFLMQIILYNNKLVQGTPLAPVISNIVFRSLDIRIERYCDKQNIRYSRYADDLLFSCSDNRALNKNFCRTIERILISKGFRINYKKTRKSKKDMVLNGYVVGENVRLSRKKMKPINRVLFYLEKNKYCGSKEWIVGYNTEMMSYIEEKNVLIESDDDLLNLLAGYRAYIISAIKNSECENFNVRAQRMIKRIENQLIIIDKEKYGSN